MSRITPFHGTLKLIILFFHFIGTQYSQHTHIIQKLKLKFGNPILPSIYLTDSKKTANTYWISFEWNIFFHLLMDMRNCIVILWKVNQIECYHFSWKIYIFPIDISFSFYENNVLENVKQFWDGMKSSLTFGWVVEFFCEVSWCIGSIKVSSLMGFLWMIFTRYKFSSLKQSKKSIKIKNSNRKFL